MITPLRLRPLMPASTFGDRLTVSETLRDWIRKHRTDLKSMGVDPDMFWQNLNVSVEAVKGANTTQEMMKAQLKRQTEVVNVADRNNYSLTTSYIDVISGAYGKFTPEAKQLRRLRSQLHRPITPPKQA